MSSFVSGYFEVLFSAKRVYIVDKPVAKVANDIARLLEAKKPLFYGPNISGRFNEDDHSFYAVPRANSVIIINDRQGDSASLYGEIKAIDKDSTRIEISVSPSYIFPALYIAGAIGGGVYTVYSILYPGPGQNVLLGLGILAFAHIVPWCIAFFAQGGMIAAFEQGMKVKPVSPTSK